MADYLPMLRSSVDRMRDEMNHTLDRLSNWGREARRGDVDLPGLFTSLMPAMPGLPAVDVDEDENEIRVKAELPGLEKDDFKVELMGNRLTIRGEKKTTQETRRQNTYQTECTYGSFSRSITLPAEVDANAIDAQYKNGVLMVRLPKSARERATPIEIKTE